MPDPFAEQVVPEHKHDFRLPSIQGLLQLSRALGGGLYPGIGLLTNDTVTLSPDNVDLTHPANFDYILPNNLVRIVRATLTWKVRQFRSPVAAVNNPAVTSGPSSAVSSGPSSAVSSGAGSTDDHKHSLIYGSTPATATTLTYDATVADVRITAGAVVAAGNTGLMSAGGGPGHTHAIPHTHDIPHTHSVTSSVTLTYGVFENTGPLPTVTVQIDGTDRTVAMGGGGGFTGDQVELDVMPYINATAGLHVIALTPSGLGRLGGALRLSMIINATLP